ncbi:MAG: chemotaxis protein CheA [Spirochaetes bacterium]|nr:chemotaxis protein CheA [Spirochaetota bacterium]
MSSSYDISNSRDIYFTEGREMLDQMEASLLSLEKTPGDDETINSLFRSIHTIKGSSGMFGFDEIGSFTHVVENILDRMRKGTLDLSPDLSALLFECHDFIGELMELYEKGADEELSQELTVRRDELLSRMGGYTDLKVAAAEKAAAAPAQAAPGVSDKDRVENQCWHISLRFGRDTFRNGLDPNSFIAYLREIGEIVRITTVYDELPESDAIDPESCYLGFEIDFKGSGTVTREMILDVFEFVREDCTIRILPPNSSIDDYVALINDLPESPMSIGEILTKSGTLSAQELQKALQSQSMEMPTGEGDKRLLGEIILEEGLVQKPVLEAALEKQKSIQKSDERNKKLIRVSVEKIDRLVNLVGELVITGSNVKQISERRNDSELAEPVSTMTRLIEDIRESTMNIRMVPIGETFKKYERTVRDLSREQGKEVDFVISGADTELDKTLIDKISDPLMHLIRNAVDHGIDRPEERVKRGKPRRGTISLNSYYETGSVVIVEKDDGNGLNRELIYAKAVETGLLQPGVPVTDDELFQLVFEPGFSTAKEVTSISGRGVGMDVVRRNIESLRGTIMLDSREGEGTTVRITLPLTLAIIDGFLVSVGDDSYVLPLDMVVECTEVSRSDLQSNDGGNFINLRGDLLPYLRLRDFFGDTSNYTGKENVVVLEYARRKVGLVIDRPVGEFQTVIKPLGAIFSQFRWVSGATILGSGSVALILDVPRLMQSNGELKRSSLNRTAGARA